MTNNPYSRLTEEERNANRRSWRSIAGKSFDLLLILTALLLLAYTGTQAYRLHAGISLEEPRPTYQVRLQVSNASGQAGLEKPIAREWAGYSDRQVSIEVVEQLGMSHLSIPETILIIRDDSPEMGAALARTLGLPKERIVTKRMAADNHQVAATLVVGKDWATALRKRPAQEI